MEEDETQLTTARRWYLANQMVEANPQLPVGLVTRGAAFLAMGRPWEAVADLDRALRLATHNANVNTSGGGSRRRREDDDEEARIRLLRGHAHAACLSYERAVADFGYAAEALGALQRAGAGSNQQGGGSSSQASGSSAGGGTGGALETDASSGTTAAHARAGLGVCYCNMRRWEDSIEAGEAAIRELAYDDIARAHVSRAIETARQHLLLERGRGGQAGAAAATAHQRGGGRSTTSSTTSANSNANAPMTSPASHPHAPSSSSSPAAHFTNGTADRHHHAQSRPESYRGEPSGGHHLQAAQTNSTGGYLHQHHHNAQRQSYDVEDVGEEEDNNVCRSSSASSAARQIAPSGTSSHHHHQPSPSHPASAPQRDPRPRQQQRPSYNNGHYGHHDTAAQQPAQQGNTRPVHKRDYASAASAWASSTASNFHHHAPKASSSPGGSHSLAAHYAHQQQQRHLHPNNGSPNPAAHVSLSASSHQHHQRDQHLSSTASRCLQQSEKAPRRVMAGGGVGGKNIAQLASSLQSPTASHEPHGAYASAEGQYASHATAPKHTAQVAVETRGPGATATRGGVAAHYLAASSSSHAGGGAVGGGEDEEGVEILPLQTGEPLGREHSESAGSVPPMMKKNGSVASLAMSLSMASICSENWGELRDETASPKVATNVRPSNNVDDDDDQVGLNFDENDAKHQSSPSATRRWQPPTAPRLEGLPPAAQHHHHLANAENATSPQHQQSPSPLNQEPTRYAPSPQPVLLEQQQ